MDRHFNFSRQQHQQQQSVKCIIVVIYGNIIWLIEEEGAAVVNRGDDQPSKIMMEGASLCPLCEDYVQPTRSAAGHSPLIRVLLLQVFNFRPSSSGGGLSRQIGTIVLWTKFASYGRGEKLQPLKGRCYTPKYANFGQLWPKSGHVQLKTRL